MSNRTRISSSIIIAYGPNLLSFKFSFDANSFFRKFFLQKEKQKRANSDENKVKGTELQGDNVQASSTNNDRRRTCTKITTTDKFYLEDCCLSDTWHD